MRYLFFLALVIVGSIFFVAPSLALTNDLGLTSITFSKDEFIAGDTTRIYARVNNYGEEDVVAYVTFWRGSIPIGNSLPVSVRAHGLADEVFVDFVVPDTQFNIRAVLQGEAAGDEVASNNEILTTVFTPLPDSDRDKITDRDDNCPGVSNADQANNDGDAMGDACDPDDDNDGVSDVQEALNGTNPFDNDSDGDGVDDAGDVFPLDRSRSKEPPPPPVVIIEEEVAMDEGTEGDEPASLVTGDDGTLPAGEMSSGDRTVSGGALETLVPKAAVREPSGRAVAEGGLSGDGWRGFWTFKNPAVFWMVIILIVLASFFLTMERLIRSKYEKFLAGEEGVTEKSIKTKKKSVAKEKPEKMVARKKIKSPPLKELPPKPAEQAAVQEVKSVVKSKKKPVIKKKAVSPPPESLTEQAVVQVAKATTEKKPSGTQTKTPRKSGTSAPEK